MKALLQRIFKGKPTVTVEPITKLTITLKNSILIDFECAEVSNGDSHRSKVGETVSRFMGRLINMYPDHSIEFINQINR